MASLSRGLRTFLFKSRHEQLHCSNEGALQASSATAARLQGCVQLFSAAPLPAAWAGGGVPRHAPAPAGATRRWPPAAGAGCAAPPPPAGRGSRSGGQWGSRLQRGAQRGAQVSAGSWQAVGLCCASSRAAAFLAKRPQELSIRVLSSVQQAQRAVWGAVGGGSKRTHPQPPSLPWSARTGAAPGRGSRRGTACPTHSASAQRSAGHHGFNWEACKNQYDLASKNKYDPGMSWAHMRQARAPASRGSRQLHSPPGLTKLPSPASHPAPAHPPGSAWSCRAWPPPRSSWRQRGR